MAKFIDVTMRLIDDFTKPLEKAGKALSDTANKNKIVGKQLETAGKSMKSVGDSLTKGITVPILGVGTAMVTIGSQFEKRMSNVQAIAQASAEDFEKLEITAIELGASTAFSANEVADAMTEMAKAGWDAERIVAGMGGVLDAAAASGEDLAITSTIIADALTGFGLKADQSSRVADLLTQSANAGTIGLKDLGESFSYISPVAASLGYSIEDTTTAITAMSQAGIKGSSAGTSLRTLMTNLVAPTSKMEDAMDKLGISLTNSDGTFKSLDEVLSNMRGGFSKLTDEQKTYYASVLGGKTGMSGMLSLMNMTQAQYDEISKSMYESSGVAKETAEIMQNNLSSKVEQLGGAFESVSISVYKLLIPSLTKIIDKATSLMEYFVKLDNESKLRFMKIAGYMALLGPSISIFGRVILAIGKMKSSVGDIGSAIKKAGSLKALIFSPAGKIILIIGAIVLAGILLAKNWNKIKEIAMNVWGYIKDIAQKCGIDFDVLKEKTSNLGIKFSESWGKMKDGAKAFWEFIKPFVKGIGDVFESVLPLAVGTLVSAFNNLLDEVFSIVDNVMVAFGGLGDFISNIFVGNWKGAFEGLKTFLSGAINALIGIMLLPTNAFIGLINGAINALNNLGFSVPDWVPGVGGKSLSFNLPTIPKLEMLYKGTDDWKGGPAMVHDRGAEIIDLPSGSRVIPHSESLDIARADGARSANNRSINIAKIADSIIVREDADIDRIATALVNKLKSLSDNIGGIPVGNMA